MRLGQVFQSSNYSVFPLIFIELFECRQALARADVLLSMKHGMTRLDNVWGVGGGLRPVTSLVRSMGLLLQEYVSSDDAAEAARCLKELEVPHFHHELVYEAIVMALEAANEETENSMVKLLKSFWDSTIITPDQMKNVISSLRQFFSNAFTIIILGSFFSRVSFVCWMIWMIFV